MWQNFYCVRSVQKVSSDFEYLENQLHGLDVTWQPVRGDITAHPRTPSRGTSQSAVRHSELVYWVTVTLTNLLPFNRDFSFGKSHKSQRAKSGLQRGWQTWVMWCFAKKMAWEMKNGQAHCCDKVASHHLPTTVAVFLLLHPSTGEGL